MRRHVLALALLPAAAAGCLREPDPFEYTEIALSVHGVVRADDRGLRLTLMRGVQGGGAEPVDAEITVSSGATAVTLAPHDGTDPDGCYGPEYPPQAFPGCYTGTLPQAPAPGSRWQLAADVAGGGTITGSTVVPAPPALLSPAAGTRLFFRRWEQPAEFDVAWQTPNAPRVEIRVDEGVAFQGGARLAGSSCFVAHRQVEAAVGQPSGTRHMYVDDVYCYNGPGGEIQWDSAAVPVMVTAFDSAYAEFALHGSSVTKKRNASLQGAYGVFGSAASARREIILIPNR
ncbi:MAG TPA: hypothetical protein VFQ45_02760 [Longimicrobium sp.]|nr:hypothetical protein [Longimicrobium sp.]